MSTEIWTAIIGSAGVIIGAIIGVLPQIIERYKALHSVFPTTKEDETKAAGEESKSEKWPDGELIELPELRILRALVGEDGGRRLSCYHNDAYYHTAIVRLKNRDWIKQVDGNYYLTPKGNKYLRKYLKWLEISWKLTAVQHQNLSFPASPLGEP